MTLPPTTIETLRAGLEADLEQYTRHSHDELQRIKRRIDDVNRQRRRWADLAMNDAVPLDIAKEEQASLAGQLVQLQHQMGSLTDTNEDHAAVIHRALATLERCGIAYAEAQPQARRELNRSWFDRIFVDVEHGEPVIDSADRTDTLEILTTAKVGARARVRIS